MSSVLPQMTIVTSVKNLINECRQDVFIQSLNSIRIQSYPHIQHIVIDGGSTDGTLEYLRKLRESNHFELHVIPDRNLWDGLNNGLGFATGKFVNFMNSDDFFSSPDAVWVAVRALEKKKAKWFFSSSSVLREDGSIYEFPTSLAGVFSCLGIVHQTMWVDTQLLRQIDPFRKPHVTRENYLMMVLILNGYPVAKSRKKLVVYREGGFSGKTYGGRNLIKTKNDFGDYFYELAGNLWGLSKLECASMFGWNCFSDTGAISNLKIFSKLGIIFLKYDFLKKYTVHLIRHKSKRRLIKELLKFILSLRVGLRIYRVR